MKDGNHKANGIQAHRLGETPNSHSATMSAAAASHSAAPSATASANWYRIRYRR
jgi:hypothetical protein